MKLWDTVAVGTTDTTETRVLVRRVLGAVVVLLPQLLVVGAKVLHLG